MDSEVPDEPGDAREPADWEREWHEQRGLAPPELRVQEEERQQQRDQIHQGQEDRRAETGDHERVQPCAYRDIRLSWADNQTDGEEVPASASEGEEELP